MTREAISLFRESGGRPQARGLDGGRVVSLGLHAVIALVLIAPRLSVPVAVEAQAQEPKPRVLHVFVPPLPKEDKKNTAGSGDQTPTPALAPAPAHQLDLDGVQLTVVGSADGMLAALLAWKGTIGIAQASDPRVVVRMLSEQGSVESTEPMSLDLFWPVRVTDVAVRQQFGTEETETLYLLFPENVLDGIMADLRKAAQLAGVTDSARLVGASYGFDSARDFTPAIDPRSLVWDRESY